MEDAKDKVGGGGGGGNGVLDDADPGPTIWR
jgi:hypothetical protein